MATRILPSTVVSLVVFGLVATVIWIRYATQYSPESPVRLWATRVAVAVILLWLGSGLLYPPSSTHNLFGLILSRRFGRCLWAILLVWAVFRDEL